MRRMCARCGALFRGRWVLHLMWCRVDRFYVCRRCWEWECREGHGKGRGTVGPGMWEVAFFALFFWCFVGIAGLAATVYGDALARSFGIAVNLPFLAAWVWALREGRRRASLHAEATQSVRPVEVKEQQLARDETLPWRGGARGGGGGGAGSAPRGPPSWRWWRGPWRRSSSLRFRECDPRTASGSVWSPASPSASLQSSPCGPRLRQGPGPPRSRPRRSVALRMDTWSGGSLGSSEFEGPGRANGGRWSGRTEWRTSSTPFHP